ncbi:hypothetical protein DF185_20565 [Marinifilum breve]|uniref:PKD domain-containing protein n=1 Tax=Marinifilum breve TaxID=2184082 RepID=A0A2V3ZST9_9BACT|nr:hypothetical protein [Marinifilum breve]PXX96175.1 hypothetical protein DF185_20565 [Marinifilum breve]
MKKLYLLFVLTFGLVHFASAQADQQVTLGTSHTYTVDPVAGYKYTWTVDAAGTNTDVSAVTGNSITVDWNQVKGTYNITVFATDATNCISETETISVEVLGQASVLFAAADDAQTCSDLDGNVFGGGASGGNSSFAVEFSGGLAPYDLIYRVLDPTGTQVGLDVEVKGLSAIDQLDVPNEFINDGTTDAVYKVVIVSAKTKDGASVGLPADDADKTRTITVLPKPRITGGIKF